MPEELQIRIHGGANLPTLIYLPGLHGDWTLAASLRAALTNRARFVEFTYPRSLTWKVSDYATAIWAALDAHQINDAWLIGESFGSQIAWELVGAHDSAARFRGLVLAGGFVKHPMKWGPGMLRRIGERTTMKSYQRQLKFYAWYSSFRHRHAPETQGSIQEFVARRTDLDRQAMRQRLVMLDQYDPRPIARQTRLPVYYLAGFVDPLVPWPLVRWWLRRNCPGYRGGKTCWLADHNVLATAPNLAADTILNWVRLEAKR